MITIVIPGKPIAQQRPRFARRGKFVTTYSAQETEAGKFWLIAKEQLPAGWAPLEGPVTVDAVFVLPVPASKSRRVREAMIEGAMAWCGSMTPRSSH